MLTDIFENPLVVAKHVAERKMRNAFQDRYGEFWKCPSCGGYVAHYEAQYYAPDAPPGPYQDACDHAAVKSGYSAKVDVE